MLISFFVCLLWFLGFLLKTVFLILMKCYSFYDSVKILCFPLLNGNSDSLSPDICNNSLPIDFFVFSSIVNVFSLLGFLSFSILLSSFYSFLSSKLNCFGVMNSSLLIYISNLSILSIFIYSGVSSGFPS
jgi:hypothetical protein